MAKNTLTKILCLALVALMMLSCFVACADDPEEPEDTTKAPEVTNDPDDTGDEKVTDKYDKDGYLKDNLPADLNYGGKTFTFLAWGDVEHPEFGIDEAEYDSSDITQKALYTRIKAVEERLGITINFIYKDGDANDNHINEFVSEVKSYVGGQHDIDAVASYSRTTAVCAANGYLYNLGTEECSYIDFDMPWWPSRLMDEVTIKGNVYFATGDISPNTLYMMYTCFVNDDLLKEYHSDMAHPSTLVDGNNWTYDRFFEYCEGVTNDVNGDGEKTLIKTGDGSDVFGYAVSANIHCDPWFYGTGATLVTKDADGNLKVSDLFQSEQVKITLEKLNNLFYNTQYGVIGSSAGYHQNNFKTGNLLFCTDRARCSFKVFAENKDLNYSILPCPTYDPSLDYVTVIGNPVTLYGLPVYAKTDGTVEMGAAVLEALASESYRTLTPVIFETIFKLRYSKDETSAHMFDIIKDNISFDFGRVFESELGGKQVVFRNAVKNNKASSWVRDAKQASSAITDGLKTLQPKLDGSQK